MLVIALSSPVLNWISVPFLKKLFHGMSVRKFFLNFSLWIFLCFISCHYFEFWL